ncbi:major facilitator superfamily MFS_1 [Rhizorhabdus wittichii RW1]|uniref:Major facilitator superfamily MFS_1 n=1 Tax=Rhizorhabdus wittichii (strain DSM 6014 / CCUG 31198 / JCM 15750 / NBRC 105917 / EY 4224 / RW1) TaxID=392499 RepID=A0A9J9HB71_RHIWR|nr:major facilitator superfamily MFS_1 [Rhizorhabdus wittichii RW1]
MTQAGSLAGAAAGERAERSGHWLPVVLLFLFIYVISYIDRQILSLVVQPVKAALGLSDFQIGLLQGLAFSLVLAVAAVLASPLIDRGNRARLLGLCMILWCGMTVLCGLAHDFGMLLLARTGLALSEAVVPMAVMSMICDIAPKASVPRASALFMAAPYIGSGFALLLGGPLLMALAPFEGVSVPMLGAFEPWRGLFFLLGIPGVAIGVLLLLFLREPARRGGADAGDPSASVIPFLRDNAGFLAPMLLANAMLNLVSYTIYAWSPTLMIRAHGMSTATAGVTVGSIFVVAGIAGCVFGSWAMSRSRDGRALSHVVRTIGLTFLCLGPPLIAFPLVPDADLALVLLAVAFFLMAAGLSSIMTPVALFAPPGVRGRALAMAGLCHAGLGGLGPLAVGAVNDFVFGTPDRIGQSLAVCLAGAMLVGLALLPRVIRLANRIDGPADRSF